MSEKQITTTTTKKKKRERLAPCDENVVRTNKQASSCQGRDHYGGDHHDDDNNNNNKMISKAAGGAVVKRVKSVDSDAETTTKNVGASNTTTAVADPPSSTPLEYRASFGEFKGNTIYRNRIVGATPPEYRKDGHYRLEELIPPNCQSALCTSFHASQQFVNNTFGGGKIPKLIVVVPSSKANNKQHVIGDALVERVEEKEEEDLNNQSEWYWIKARPHSEGCFHSKILLFRCPAGLRVIISGNNLTKRQWESHRDVFWAQDFPCYTTTTTTTSEERGSSSSRLQMTLSPGSFGYKLHQVVQEMTATKSRQNQTIINRHLVELFENIDFVTSAKAQLVVSFPRRKEEPIFTSTQHWNGSWRQMADKKGGWRQLSSAVYNAMHNAGMMAMNSTKKEDPNDSSDDDDDDEMGGGCGGDRSQQQQQQQQQKQLTPTLYATSGSLGDIKPDFLLQMWEAMNGKEPTKKGISARTEWIQVDNLVKVLWPSVATATTMDLTGLCCNRTMPKTHLDTIPKTTLHRILHDAIPNPPSKSTSWLDETKSFHCITHGKFMYNNRGVLYVGSHNFSKAAWGLRDSMPKNIEIGIVLASMNPETQAEWIQRLPCHLVAPSTTSSPRSYVPYSGWRSIRKHHPLARKWTNYWKRFHAMDAAQKLYNQAHGVLRESDRWLIETPLEGQTLEELQTLLEEYGPVIEECIKEVLDGGANDD